MPTTYSPIDESSYSDSTSFDPEEMLNPPVGTPDSSNTPPQAVPPIANPVTDTVSPQPDTQPHPEPEAAAEDVPASRPAWLEALIASVSGMRLFKFFGIVLFFFAAYTFVVSCSYFFTLGSDQSALLNGELNLDMYENAGRRFGAILAHTLIYNWVGVGAFILIFYLGACGLSMIGVYRPGFWGMTMRCLLSTVAVSVVAGLVTYEIASPVYWGGMHGQLLNRRLIDFTGIWGAIAVSLILLSMMVLLYINELRNGWSVLSSGLDGYRAKQAERRARRESRRLQEANDENRRLREENDRLRADLASAQASVRDAAMAAASQPARPTATTDSVVATTPASAPAHTSSIPPLHPAADLATETVPEAVYEAETSDVVAASVSDNEPADNLTTDTSADTLADTAESCADTADTDNTVENTDDSGDIDSPLFPSSDSDTEQEQDIETEPLTPLFADSITAVDDPDADIVDPRGLPPYNPRADLSNFHFPDIELLRPAKEAGPSIDVLTMEENKQRIINTLKNCGVTISHIEATIGPTVTLYEIIPADGVRTRSIKSLGDDLQLRLAALGIRIIAPIPAKGTIGIEVPNKDPQVVPMRTVLDSDAYRNNKMELPMALGKTISGDIFMADLAKMPHLLVAGATGMGKSVGLNAIIASLLYKKHPAELKFVLIDPKRVELSLYRKLERHYLAALPDEDAIITDMSKVVTVLNSLCIEMDNRLKLLEKAGARNIKEYNEKFIARRLNMNKHRFLPYIVLVIDEFADLIIRQGKEIEEPVSRLAAVARAAGIHLIIATQRPTVNVITGNIKLNIPGRIAFRVIQGNDSRTILDQLGANQLIGKGDMLFSNNGKLERVQCAFIDTPEVSDICDSIGEQVGYTAPYELPEYVPEGNDTASVASLTDRDPLFDECARFIVSSDTASTSSLQRRYNIGYNRAGRIMDQMEAAGIVGASQGGKPRSVLVDLISLERILDNK